MDVSTAFLNGIEHVGGGGWLVSDFLQAFKPSCFKPTALSSPDNGSPDVALTPAPDSGSTGRRARSTILPTGDEEHVVIAREVDTARRKSFLRSAVSAHVAQQVHYGQVVAVTGFHLVIKSGGE
ncbi:hypothetical protein ON010_g519 [Phytophthora cinnamomi]|nr:hypothetical protein ON010_g519 [Phytophthora cinnamomi]